ncbi:uncharacterized protein N7496_000516 [Penicillium cataractarum]|uniref:F-box domain-containing protein n=1 Tax=Penicillium cataractarum TaxID=2100454 RepID=A0A9X0B602_9EURO|nr:uncharacterized protein N7496_000516 [Penicillium cataractarum]KAJ5389448.1 hypothetical protein N7496_000516 [Penicillium cataractarum]
MSLLLLPNEVLLMIAEEAPQKDMNSMAQLNRFFYSLINRRLYARNVKYSGSSGLTWATIHGHLATFQHFIKAGVDITKSTNPITHGLFHLAAKHGKVEVAQLLIEHGARINRFDNSFKSPLHLAATYGHAAVVELLLKHGATLNENTNNYVPENPLHIAAKYGHTEVVRLLLQAGCNVNRPTSRFQETPLHLSLMPAQYRSLRKNAQISHRRSQKGKTAIVLLEHGADIHVRRQMGRGRTPLHLAIDSEQVKVIQRLLEMGASPWDRIDPTARLPAKIDNAVDLAESCDNYEVKRVMGKAMYPEASSWRAAPKPQWKFEGWGDDEVNFDVLCALKDFQRPEMIESGEDPFSLLG